MTTQHAHTVAALPSFDADAFGGYCGEAISIEHDGFTITATLHHDDCGDTPWDREDGHGPVSDWVRRDKEPGELILATDHGSHRFYDFAEACRIARRDGWGVPAGTLDPGSPRAMAALAARQDFERLRAWCNDDWSYVGVTVTVSRDIDGDMIELTGECDHALWGIESDAGAYLAEVANGMIGEALNSARARAAVVARELVEALQ